MGRSCLTAVTFLHLKSYLLLQKWATWEHCLWVSKSRDFLSSFSLSGPTTYQTEISSSSLLVAHHHLLSVKYKTAYRWCFWFKKQDSFLPYTSLMTELAYFYYNVTIWWSFTSWKIYGWSLLNAYNGILKKNERSSLFFPLWSQVLFIGLTSVLLHVFL